MLGAMLTLPMLLLSLSAMFQQVTVLGRVIFGLCGGICLTAASVLLTRGPIEHSDENACPPHGPDATTDWSGQTICGKCGQLISE